MAAERFYGTDKGIIEGVNGMSPVDEKGVMEIFIVHMEHGTDVFLGCMMRIIFFILFIYFCFKHATAIFRVQRVGVVPVRM